MDNSVYAILSRQTGLMDELRVLADNIANASTTGFRREAVVFAEFVAKASPVEPSLSMGTALGRRIDDGQGSLTSTGSPFDLAIEGEGFFEVETPDGVRLTRAGRFSSSVDGLLVTSSGYPVLDTGGAPLFLPPDAAQISIGLDGTMSADGAVIGQIGIVTPSDWNELQRRGSTMFESAEVRPVETPRVLQGFLETSNVAPFAEFSRLIEVQHAYVQGQKFLEQENERVRSVIAMLAK